MKRYVLAAVLASAISVVPAHAQFAKVEDAVDYRQGAFSVMSYHFGQINRALKGEIPFTAESVSANANLVATLAKLPWIAFPAGSTANSHAKPEIWKDPEKFKQLQEKLVAQTDKLATIAKEGDQAVIKSAFGDTAKVCKECHDTFRSKH
jgi:cytochrome c556